MNRKKISVLIATALVLTSLFTSCGTASTSSSNTTSQQQVFNEVTAKTDSKKALESFLNSHKNNEILINSTDKNEIKAYVDKNFSQYFTSDFLNDTDNQIENGTINYQHATFYLSQYPNSINFACDFLIDSPTVDKENKTVTYPLTEKVGAQYLIVQMKMENGVWKINKVNN